MIYERNMQRLRELGLSGWQALGLERRLKDESPGDPP